MPARFSAVCTTSVPDIVTGPVAPVSGTEMISEGRLCRAHCMMLSEVRTLQRSGDDGQASKIANGFSVASFSEPRTIVMISNMAPNDSSRNRPVTIGLLQFWRSEEHTSELQSLAYLVCRLLLEKKKKNKEYSSMIGRLKYRS